MSAHSSKADLLLLLVTLIAAAGWIFSKESLAGLDPLLFMGSRFLLAGLILLPFAYSELVRFRPRDLGRVLLVSLMFCGAMLFWILGLYYGQHLGIGAFLTSTGVLLAPLVALLFGDRPAKTVWLALPMGGAGLALLSLDSQFIFGIGEFYYLLAALCFAFHINLNGRAAGRTSIIALTAIQLLSVGCVLLPISALLESWSWPQQGQVYAWFAASVLLATSLRFFLQTYALKLTAASHAAVLMTLEPVWTALLGALWYAETMALLQFVGCALIFSAVLMTRARAARALLRQLYQRVFVAN